jgi:hypothetical protein
VHVKAPAPAPVTHVALFWHGKFRQPSTSVLQSSPLNPAAHVHVWSEVPTSAHTPVLLHTGVVRLTKALSKLHVLF